MSDIDGTGNPIFFSLTVVVSIPTDYFTDCRCCIIFVDWRTTCGSGENRTTSLQMMMMMIINIIQSGPA